MNILRQIGGGGVTPSAHTKTHPGLLRLSALIALAWVTPALAAEPELARIRSAKTLVCATNTEEGDYSRSDDHGAREAFDRDLCKAVAVAILGPEAKILLKPFPDDATSVAALREGKVDLLPTLTLDFTHATERGLAFSPVILWDGVGFMVPVASGIDRPESLSGKKVCYLAETEVEDSTQAWFRSKSLHFNPFPFQEEGEMEAALVTGGCAAVAGDQTHLAATLIGFGEVAPKFRILPESIAKDPLAAAFRRDDEAFGQIVAWTLEVLIAAEEEGMTQASVATIGAPGGAAEWNMTLRRLLGKTHDLGARLNLPDNWAVQVIQSVGNYGEIFNRTLGKDSPMNMERGWNRLQKNGGLIVSLPLK